jgi:hypothetical protein
MEKIKKHYLFWLGLLLFITLNRFITGKADIITESSSIGLLIIYIVGYFKLTNLHN